MRRHGHLTRWNDDRGFGFITPAGGGADLFVHVSAFPRDGARPRPDELISFEVEPGQDGKPRAVRVQRVGSVAPARRAPVRPPNQPRHAGPGWRGTALAAVVIVAGALALLHVVERREAQAAKPVPPRMGLLKETKPDMHFQCDGRTHCSEMTSCAEARYFLEHCPGTQMDGDGDGQPCESQHCN
ncbi:cold shock domain-containing protein [bacterium BD-1]|nr:cold shock domain-containing protein [Ottowia caeni]